MEATFKLFNKLFGLLLLMFVINMVVTYKLESSTVVGGVKEMKRPKSYVSVNNVDKTLECLAMNIYKEAAQESFEGKVAVAQVTLNRVNHPKFPKEVCSVVYEKNVIMSRVVCQFSWYCDSAYRARPVNKAAYQESYAVAKKVLLEGFKLDMLDDAIFYHAVYVNPRWPYERVGVIGNHIFYRSKT